MACMWRRTRRADYGSEAAHFVLRPVREHGSSSAPIDLKKAHLRIIPYSTEFRNTQVISHGV